METNLFVNSARGMLPVHIGHELLFGTPYLYVEADGSAYAGWDEAGLMKRLEFVGLV